MSDVCVAEVVVDSSLVGLSPTTIYIIAGSVVLLCAVAIGIVVVCHRRRRRNRDVTKDDFDTLVAVSGESNSAVKGQIEYR